MDSSDVLSFLTQVTLSPVASARMCIIFVALLSVGATIFMLQRPSMANTNSASTLATTNYDDASTNPSANLAATNQDTMPTSPAASLASTHQDATPTGSSNITHVYAGATHIESQHHYHLYVDGDPAHLPQASEVGSAHHAGTMSAPTTGFNMRGTATQALEQEHSYRPSSPSRHHEGAGPDYDNEDDSDDRSR